MRMLIERLLGIRAEGRAPRTAQDFNQVYAKPDPWRTEGHAFRIRALERAIGDHVKGRRVLELGCGEGALTQTIFRDASHVRGIDISDIAIARAKARNLPNAEFIAGDFLHVSLDGFDVIALIHSLYYLSPDEQDALLSRIAHEHDGIVIISCPIIGSHRKRQYFTHESLLSALRRHGMRLLLWRNVSVDFRTPARLLAGQVIKRAGMVSMLDILPESFVLHRIYVAQFGGEP